MLLFEFECVWCECLSEYLYFCVGVMLIFFVFFFSLLGVIFEDKM